MPVRKTKPMKAMKPRVNAGGNRAAIAKKKVKKKASRGNSSLTKPQTSTALRKRATARANQFRRRMS